MVLVRYGTSFSFIELLDPTFEGGRASFIHGLWLRRYKERFTLFKKRIFQIKYSEMYLL